MMKNRMKLQIGLLSLMIFGSCDSIQKKSFISDLNSFVTEVDQKSVGYNPSQWEETDLKFQEYIESDYNKYKAKMSPEERSKVNKLIGKYQAIRLKAGIDELKSEFQDAMEQGQGMVDEILSDTTSLKNN